MLTETQAFILGGLGLIGLGVLSTIVVTDIIRTVRALRRATDDEALEPAPLYYPAYALRVTDSGLVPGVTTFPGLARHYTKLAAAEAAAGTDVPAIPQT